MNINVLGREGLIDAEDEAIFLSKTWRISSAGKGYLVTGKGIYLHRLIARAEKGQVVDHINGETMDNRRCNLRICSQRENIQARATNRASGSGYRGVRWDKARKRWEVRLVANGVQRRGGRYKSLADAVDVWNRLASEAYGEFAPTQVFRGP